MSGSVHDFDWHGRTARAWIPDPLASRDLTLQPSTIEAARQASFDLRLADRTLPVNWEPMARIILRTEGIASSSIEGISAPVDEILIAEHQIGVGQGGWIADNLKAFEAALSSPVLDLQTMNRWHRLLMSHSQLHPDLIGELRASPSWIGGTSPLDAVFVPPPAGLVPDLMADLVEFVQRDDLDPTLQAAIAHGQLETIHPYGDGNGRIGRILIGWILHNKGVTARVPPPVSVMIARDTSGYLAGLFDFREGSLDRWVAWMSTMCSQAATQTTQMVDAVTEQLRAWEGKLEHLRKDSAARRALGLLPMQPALNAAIVALELGISERAARSGLAALSEAGIVEQSKQPAPGRGRPTSWWVAPALLDAAREWTT